MKRTLPWFRVIRGGGAAAVTGTTRIAASAAFDVVRHTSSFPVYPMPSDGKRRRRSNNNNRCCSSSASAESGLGAVVRVTKTSRDAADALPAYGLEREALTGFVDDLLKRTRALMDRRDDDDHDDDDQGTTRSLPSGDAATATAPDPDPVRTTAHHVIAFSGGIDSSVAAALVRKAATSPTLASGVYRSEKVTAVLGLSPAVPEDQRKLAEEVAATIGVDFEHVRTTEGADDLYVANDGRACLACKTHLYDNLRSIAAAYRGSVEESDDDSRRCRRRILYNGTNADDRKDETRLGLIAARDFRVRSPLADLPKARVREVGRHLGLPNWDHAASPCLRSRLAMGVLATPLALRDVGSAESFVRDNLSEPWDVRRSLRVRILSGNRARIEVDDDALLEELEDLLRTPRWKSHFEDELGFASVDARRFRSGSVAPSPDRIAAAIAATEEDHPTPRKLRRRP
mmetsp:Transcript_22195/g.52758  ORF Transcript_22195/g.52758 Transcript_22195/m.52758 type:complete len:458 (+) Transcript_22195:122-1495(+)